MGSPYEPVYRSVFVVDLSAQPIIYIRINPKVSPHEALTKIAAAFKRYDSSEPFDYKFMEDEYAKKFGDEQRIGKLAGGFTILAIFISCLGLLGMAAFTAEQRRKEIGVRKVLGDTVFGIWRLLAGEFVALVIIALCLALPIAYYFMNSWLQNYNYRTDLSWQIFVTTSAGTIAIYLTNGKLPKYKGSDD